MTKLSDIVLRGTLAARPAAGIPGRLYFATDSAGTLYRDNGSSWDSVETSASGMTNPMSAQDDLIIGGASGAATRLAKGTDGQVLTVDPTTHHLVWATPAAGGTVPVFRAHKNGTTQSITAASYQKVTFGTETFDVGGYFDSATNSRYTPPAGKYLLVTEVTWQVLGSVAETHIYANGASIQRAIWQPVAGSEIGTYCIALVDANGTDYYEVFVTQGSGTRVIEGLSVATYFAGFKVD